MMDTAYHTHLLSRFGEIDDPPVAVRRHTDRCFHRVEEITPLGFVIAGHLLPTDEIAQVRELDSTSAPLPPCQDP